GAGVVGLVIWPVWFGMDFKDAAGKDAAALEARQKYLTVLATQRCSAPPAPPVAGKRSPPPGQSAKASGQPPPTATPMASAKPEPEAETEPQVAPYQNIPH